MSTEETRDNIAPEAQEEMSEESLNELRKIRRDKLKALQEAGRNPFLEEKWDVTAHSKDIKDNFDAMEDQEVSCAGRIMAFRNMGKIFRTNREESSAMSDATLSAKRNTIGSRLMT